MNAKGTVFKYKDNVDTDVIIPARYLNTSDPNELAKHCMEDIDADFVSKVKQGDIIVADKNFGCGSSREHAPWVLEYNNINIVIAENFARIFRQNMFNCGLMAIQLDAAVIDEIFKTFAGTEAELTTDLDKQTFTITNGKVTKSYPFAIGDFDRELVKAGGWVSYADKKY